MNINLKKMLLPLLLITLSTMVSCGGCPTVAIPVYEVTVYDSVTGELLCNSYSDWGNDQCGITFTYSENDRTIADITATFDNYQPQTQNDVANLSGQYACFSQSEYTTHVEFYLDPL